jgi:DNA-binding FadR family transcriptional regulator
MSEPVTQLSRRSLAEQVTDSLIEYILAEGLTEGDSLPSSAELSERYGVSRTVIREALAALGGRGVLTRSQGRESVVATPGASDLVKLLQFRVSRRDVGLGHILDARLGLEVTGARRAAELATPEQVADIRAEFEALAETATKKESGYHAADIRLHRAIAVASANPLIVLILDALGDFLMDFRVKATKNRRSRGESLEPVIEQHRQIVLAIEAGDGDAAAEAMREHLESSRAEIP